jgi:hypothetical protein
MLMCKASLRTLRLVLFPCISAALAMWMLLLLLRPVPHAVHAAPSTDTALGDAPPGTPCDSVTAISTLECEALVTLYVATDGPTWINSRNWLTTAVGITPCDWHGVVCESGHVTQLLLGANGLKGSLPPAIGNFTQLTHLSLESNRLRGAVPEAICALTGSVRTADLGYNGLESTNRRIRSCLDQLDPDWLATQTVAPRNLQVTDFFSDALQLAWSPIPYTADGGHYEVSYTTSITGTYAVHGQTVDKNATGYRLDGLDAGRTYYIRVRAVTPAHAAHTQEVRSQAARTSAVTRAPGERVLVLAYFPADNDLAPHIPYVIDRFRRGTAVNPNVRVLLLADGAGADDTRVVEIADDRVAPTDLVFEQWGVRELDTADPTVLAWFLSTTRTLYPAERTIVTLMGHGMALTPEVAWVPDAPAGQPPATPQPGIPPLPRGHDFTPGDITAGSYMSTLDLGRALAAATDDGAAPFDLIFFDQCFQGNLDILYEVRWAAEVFVASPNYAWLVAAYDKYLTQFTPTATTAEMANAIIHLYQRSLNDFHPNAIFWVRGADIATIADAVSTLGTALRNAVRDGQDALILGAAANSTYADTTQCGRQNLTLGPPDELIGGGRFAQNLQRAFPVDDAAGVHAAADALMTALARTQRTYRVGRPYLAPEEIWDYDDAITLLAPLPRSSPARAAWRASIYTDAAAIPAQWSISPTQTVLVTSTFAFVRDGAWDEFIAEWYTTPLTPTVGAWCHYIPPAVVVTGTVEAISLTVSAVDESGTALRLNWTESNDDTASGYEIYMQGPFDIDWVLLAAPPLTEPFFIHEPLERSATYRYMVLARGVDGFVAQSKQVEWSVPATEPEQRIYVPISRR